MKKNENFDVNTIMASSFKDNANETIAVQELSMILLSDLTDDEKLKRIDSASHVKNQPNIVKDAMALCCSVNVELTLKLIESRPSLIQELDDESVMKLFDKKHGLVIKNEPLWRRLKDLFIKKLPNKEQIDAFYDILGGENTRKLLASYEAMNLFQKQIELYDHISDAQKIRNAGHQLGLRGEYFESNHATLAYISTHKRFRELTNTTSHEVLPLANIHDETLTLEQHLHTHGDLIGIQAGWENHSFSFHFVQDSQKLHIIYVNRGQKHELANPEDSPVSVYTLPNNEDTHQLIQALHDELKTEDREKISRFIHTKLPPINREASGTLAKSNQKVGNCTLANANIAWHFKIASDLMKKNYGLSFAEAYKQSAQTYKTMRMEDRAQAFSTLIKLRNSYEKQEHFQDAVMQVVVKMSAKDEKKPARQTVDFLVNKLAEQYPEGLQDVLEQIMLDSNTGRLSEKYQWVQAIATHLPEGEDKQKAMTYLKTNQSAIDLNKLLKTKWTLFSPEEAREHLAMTDSALLNMFIKNCKADSNNQKLLFEVLKYEPNYLKDASLETVTFMLNNTINEEQRSICRSCLERGLIRHEHLQQIVSNWNFGNVAQEGNSVKFILVHKPELIHFANPEFIIELLTYNCTDKEERIMFINHLHENQLCELIDSLDRGNPKHEELFQILFSSRLKKPDHPHENLSSKSFSPATTGDYKKNINQLKGLENTSDETKTYGSKSL